MNHYFDASKALEKRHRKRERGDGGKKRRTTEGNAVCIHGVSVQMHCISCTMGMCFLHPFLHTNRAVRGRVLYVPCTTEGSCTLYVEVIMPLPGESIALRAGADCGKSTRGKDEKEFE